MTPNHSPAPDRWNWQIRGQRFELCRRPKIMGILNVTPDSFSDGGNWATTELALKQALKLLEDGADLIDIGGESSRPGAEPVSVDEELQRVVPVVERLVAETSVPISIDTTKSRVAREALAAGAHIINDISGLRDDPAMVETCVEFGAGVVCMHMQGTPQTMQIAPHYEDVRAEIREFFADRYALLTAAGVQPDQLVWDPGVGFGKTPQHNLEILAHVRGFEVQERPVLIGHSRKRFLQKLLGRPLDERASGTLGVSFALALQGTALIRVHDVAVHRDAFLACREVLRRCDDVVACEKWVQES